MSASPPEKEEKWSARAFWAFFLVLLNGLRLFRWILAIIVVAFPPIYLAYYPRQFTRLVDTMFSVFLFLLAFWIGSTGKAENKAAYNGPMIIGYRKQKALSSDC